MQLSNKWLSQLPVNNIVSCETVHGGDMNEAFRIKTTEQTYFMKVQPNKPASFFAHEKRGLAEMAKAGVNTLKVLASGQIEGDAYLLLNWLDTSSGSQSELGKMVAKFSDYYAKNKVEPSLCHGDLWWGNVMFANNQPYLIDPDAVYADREFDLAMTTVFGGFNEEFYVAYDKTYPLKSGFEKRLNWYRFYYLCMHLDLFGETYGPAVDGILSNF
ncbi:fructosamine kinase family protein [Lactobacillus ultunensis]|uniref:Phosphotransferase enzyme family n=1 Tax=Lactobacillus ultunensis DSM 16047 TaxID=525365 RepID=C2ENQ1_9LACO|nr:fructosamine kinase family protein [Lactobacillus ultunensis]EEJ71840.1 phosphotransferase enzyme family [Lactobacillus ultunensis DSM 16047]KRL80529.1 fructosamine kinase [Lactobacillus ultunensis DSM 16047]QQP28615.1 fructosamine kinase family protein [Lactobacillus ultunensis]